MKFILQCLTACGLASGLGISSVACDSQNHMHQLFNWNISLDGLQIFFKKANHTLQVNAKDLRLWVNNKLITDFIIDNVNCHLELSIPISYRDDVKISYQNESKVTINSEQVNYNPYLISANYTSDSGGDYVLLHFAHREYLPTLSQFDLTIQNDNQHHINYQVIDETNPVIKIQLLNFISTPAPAILISYLHQRPIQVLISN